MGAGTKSDVVAATANEAPRRVGAEPGGREGRGWACSRTAVELRRPPGRGVGRTAGVATPVPRPPRPATWRRRWARWGGRKGGFRSRTCSREARARSPGVKRPCPGEPWLAVSSRTLSLSQSVWVRVSVCARAPVYVCTCSCVCLRAPPLVCVRVHVPAHVRLCACVSAGAGGEDHVGTLQFPDFSPLLGSNGRWREIDLIGSQIQYQNSQVGSALLGGNPCPPLDQSTCSRGLWQHPTRKISSYLATLYPNILEYPLSMHNQGPHPITPGLHPLL